MALRRTVLEALMDREDAGGREMALQNRYLALRSLGWRGVIWGDSGAYYVARDFYRPSWDSKIRIGLDELDGLLSHAESEMRRPVQREVFCDISKTAVRAAGKVA
jgi:hypothetical protein